MHALSPEAAIERRSLARVAHFSHSLPADLRDRLWKSPESLMSAGQTMRRTGQRWTVKLTWKSQSYVLKRHAPTWVQAVRQLAAPSIAWSTWWFTCQLIDAGVRTPQPLACVENRWGPLRRASYLMYPFVEGRILNTYFGAPEEKHNPIIDGLWRQLDDLWKCLASLQANLEDPNLNNFVVSSSGQLWVIDLDKSRFHRSRSATARSLDRGWKKLTRGVVIGVH